jgi:hypothetical protein
VAASAAYIVPARGDRRRGPPEMEAAVRAIRLPAFPADGLDRPLRDVLHGCGR